MRWCSRWKRAACKSNLTGWKWPNLHQCKATEKAKRGNILTRGWLGNVIALCSYIPSKVPLSRPLLSSSWWLCVRTTPNNVPNWIVPWFSWPPSIASPFRLKPNAPYSWIQSTTATSGISASFHATILPLVPCNMMALANVVHVSVALSHWPALRMPLEWHWKMLLRWHFEWPGNPRFDMFRHARDCIAMCPCKSYTICLFANGDRSHVVVRLENATNKQDSSAVQLCPATISKSFSIFTEFTLQKSKQIPFLTREWRKLIPASTSTSFSMALSNWSSLSTPIGSSSFSCLHTWSAKFLNTVVFGENANFLL